MCLLVRVPGCRCMCYLSLILCSGGAFLATLSVIVNLIGKTLPENGKFLTAENRQEKLEYRQEYDS